MPPCAQSVIWKNTSPGQRRGEQHRWRRNCSCSFAAFTIKAVASSSIVRWLRTVLEEAGVDVSTFRTHSTRGAATSAAVATGIFYRRHPQDSGLAAGIHLPSVPLAGHPLNSGAGVSASGPLDRQQISLHSRTLHSESHISIFLLLVFSSSSVCFC